MIMELVKLGDKTIEIVENNGFSLQEIIEQDGQYYVEMNQSTPEGEDWWVDSDGDINKIKCVLSVN